MSESFVADQYYVAKLEAKNRQYRSELEKAKTAIKDAYMEGFFDKATYNDAQVNDENEEFEESRAKVRCDAISAALKGEQNE